MASRIVVVGGGTGYIGRHLCKALEKNGYLVKVVSRSTKNNALTWEVIKRVGLPAGTHAVFNLAGELVLNPLKRWSKSLENEIIESRVYTTSLLRDTIVDSEVKPKFWGSCSGVGYYPPKSGANYDEDSCVDAGERDYWSKFAQRWEEAAALPEHLEHGIQHVTLRTGVVIGPEGGALRSMYPAFIMGVGGPMGSGQQWFPWIHLDDVVELWIYALESSTMRGVYNAVSQQKITNQQFSTTFGNILRRPAVIKLPEWVVKMMFGRVRASMLLEGQSVHPKRTIQSGFRFKYNDIHSALQASI